MAIFTALVRNKMGLDYRIVQDNTEPFSTIICETLQKSILVIASVGDINRGWYKWIHEGKLAQDAFPFLAHEQREFLISGITPVEWNEMFGAIADDEKDEDEDDSH